MKLSIITINFNNLAGLKKTINSVLNQTYIEFEYIIIDGGSNDGSKELIQNFSNNSNLIKIKWISEPDSGIYNAMNKGIKMASGEYLQFLNSGDFLVSNAVIGQMIEALMVDTQILYGNMLKPIKNKFIIDKGFAGRQPTMLDFYRGTLNHSPAFINKTLFDKFGLYDETLKIVSDWKWYLQVIVFNNTFIQYINIDVTIFEMNGISNSNKQLEFNERNQVLNSLLPEKVIQDYQKYSFPIEQYERIAKYKFINLIFYFFERVIFKIESFFYSVK